MCLHEHPYYLAQFFFANSGMKRNRGKIVCTHCRQSTDVFNMKNKSLKEKFARSVNFVKPLYKKVTLRNKSLVVDIESNVKLEGSDIDVNKCFRGSTIKTVLLKNNCVSKTGLPGLCQIEDSVKVTPKKRSVNISDGSKEKSEVSNMIAVVGLQNENADSVVLQETDGQGEREVIVHVQDHWLRVYPAPMLRDESISSVFLRCVLCQLGLMTLLIIWTMLWAVVIYCAEEPYETAVSREFHTKQNQLIIDLATELRQITPVSPKWRAKIEQRIENERMLTEAAVGQGARFDSGRFWDLPGTFLFTIYVMTALGFGAPVPNTLYGRGSSLVYAIFAVPTHIYLMWNASASFIALLERCKKNMKKRRRKTRSSHGSTGSGSAHSQVKKTSTVQKQRDKLLTCISILWIGRGIPLAATLYYAFGAVAFGVLRSRSVLDVIMFPLEFTTTGGLAHVESFPRVLYGFYVEGAMSLLACALATLRRHSSETLIGFGEHYRLFTFDKVK